MITQSFLIELESSMLRSFARAQRALTAEVPGVLASAQFNERFSKEFMRHLQERQGLLEQEIRQGGHEDYVKIADNVYKVVEQRVRSALTGNSLHERKLDEYAFRKTVRDVKTEVRSAFYERYFSPSMVGKQNS
ncbi:MAG: hypothetical protein AABX37_03805 [Nanoarchaeota archaeon]